MRMFEIVSIRYWIEGALTLLQYSVGVFVRIVSSKPELVEDGFCGRARMRRTVGELYMRQEDGQGAIEEWLHVSDSAKAQ